MFTQVENGLRNLSAHARVLACWRRLRKSRAKHSAALPRTPLPKVKRGAAGYYATGAGKWLTATNGGQQV
jgi:hypothetical protein